LALGADREQRLQQQRPQQAFRRDRFAAERRVQRGELAIQAREHVIDELPDLAQRMLRRDPRFEVHI